jgi:hypothetical protein
MRCVYDCSTWISRLIKKYVAPTFAIGILIFTLDYLMIEGSFEIGILIFNSEYLMIEGSFEDYRPSVFVTAMAKRAEDFWKYFGTRLLKDEKLQKILNDLFFPMIRIIVSPLDFLVGWWDVVEKQAFPIIITICTFVWSWIIYKLIQLLYRKSSKFQIFIAWLFSMTIIANICRMVNYKPPQYLDNVSSEASSSSTSTEVLNNSMSSATHAPSAPDADNHNVDAHNVVVNHTRKSK